MKSTENFKAAIQAHLDHAASVNSVFANKLKDPKKNIDDCITYILNQVQKSGLNGFEDTEIYGMAMHYYDEEKIDIGGKFNGQVIVNHEVKLTEKEIEELREKARQQVIDEERAKMTKKNIKPMTKPEAKPNAGDSAIGTLF